TTRWGPPSGLRPGGASGAKRTRDRPPPSPAARIPAAATVSALTDPMAHLPPAAFGRVITAGRLQAVVPPAGVPQALEQRPGITGDEVQVAKEGLFQQAQDSPPWPPLGQSFECQGEVLRQLDGHSRLNFRLQEGGIKQQGF